MDSFRDIYIPLSNGNNLAGSLFTPSDKEIKGAVMIGPATGIKRRFYAPFAAHLAEHGFGVITFDNQGVGGSLHGSLKHSTVTLQDWGYMDMPAVLDYLIETFPKVKYHLVGHSAGGQLIGLMHNWSQLTSIFNVSSSSGSIKNMKQPFYTKAVFFMQIFIPLSNLIFGYSKINWAGMGEPLPRKVGVQWSEWCAGKGYIVEAFDKTIHEHWYDEIDLPTMWVNATDDDIAGNINVEEMIAVYTKLKVDRIILDPNELKVKEIGHMKFFSRKNSFLWKHALDWLESNL